MTQVEQLLVRIWGPSDMSFRGWMEIRTHLYAMLALASALAEWDVAATLTDAIEVANGLISLAMDDEYRTKTEAA